MHGRRVFIFVSKPYPWGLGPYGPEAAFPPPASYQPPTFSLFFLEVFAEIAIIGYYQRPSAEMASAPSRGHPHTPSSAGGR